MPSPRSKTGQNCYVTPAFSGVPDAKRADKIRIGHLTRAFSGAQKRAELLRNPCILGSPLRQGRGENQNWPPHTCLLRGPKRGRDRYVIPAFSGVTNAKYGDKIRIHHLTRAFSEGQKRAELLRNPCILGGPLLQARGQIKNSPPNPCLLGGLIEGGVATQLLHSQGSPTPSAVTKSRIGHLTRAFSGAQNRGIAT